MTAKYWHYSASHLVSLILALAMTLLIFSAYGQTPRKKPSGSEVDAHFQDQSGSLPVAPDFDAIPGELCSNGKTYYWTSVPPKKPIPPDWRAPPRPGRDPAFVGPHPAAAFKESPYAMPTPKVVVRRQLLVDANDPTLRASLGRAVAKVNGPIGYLGDRHAKVLLPELSERLQSVAVERFAGRDDQPVARWLREQRVELLLVDRTSPEVLPWTDPAQSTVRLKLRDAIAMDWFHPLVIGSGWVLYRISEPFRLSLASKRALTARARGLLSGTAQRLIEIDAPLAATGFERYRAIVGLRWRANDGLKGRKIGRRIGNGVTVVAAIDAAVGRLVTDWQRIRGSAIRSRNVDLDTIPTSAAAAVGQMELDIDVLFDGATIVDRDPSRWREYLEIGVEGISLIGRTGEGRRAFYYLEPSDAVHFDVRTERRFLERMLVKARLFQFLRRPTDKNGKLRSRHVLTRNSWMEDRTFTLGRFRTVNWVEVNPGGEIVEIYRGVPLKTKADVTRENLVHSLQLGADWLMKHQSEDGQYAYKYEPLFRPGRRWTPGGNIVRHALNPYTLLMVNKIAPRPEYVASAKRGIDFTLNFLRRDGRRCVICHRDPPARYYNAKLGTVAVTILSILKLADVAPIDEYEDTLRCLAEELLFMQDPNGHYWQYDVPPVHPYYGAENTIAPGEFIFALARMYTHTGDPRYKASVDKALPWYLAMWRRMRDNRTEDGIYDEEHRVNLVGIVPWLVTAMHDLFLQTNDRQYGDIAFEMQEWLDHEFFYDEARAAYPDYLGASFKIVRELPAINSCQYSEGAAAAYDLARRIGHKVDRRREIVLKGARFCLQLQFDSPGSTYFLPRPNEALGGYRYTLGHLRLRNDYNYHAMAALALAVEFLQPEDYSAQ